MKTKKDIDSHTDPKILDLRDKVLKLPVITDYIDNCDLDATRTPPETKKEIEYCIGGLILLSLELSFNRTLLPLEDSRESPYTKALDKCESIVSSAQKLLKDISDLDPVTKLKVVGSDKALNLELNRLIKYGLETKVNYHKKVNKEKALLIQSLQFCWETLVCELGLDKKEMKNSTIEFISIAINYYPKPHCDVGIDAIRKALERLDKLEDF